MIDLATPEGQKFLRNIIVIGQGGNPEAQQSLNEFMSFDDDIERTNLPTRRDVQRASFWLYVGATFFPDIDDDPFTIAGKCVAKGFMAKSGEKSKQFVDMFRQSPDLAALERVGNNEQSLTDRILGRGKRE